MRLYLQMTVMNGYEATKAIRRSSHELAKTIPIIAMTANAFKYFLNTFRNRNKPKGYFPLKRHTREGLVVSILRGKLPGCSKYIYIFHWRTI